MTIEQILSQNPVVPVLTARDAGVAVDVAAALHAGGVNIIEIALRSPEAIAAISGVRNAVPGMTVGAGTIRTPEDFSRVAGAGAQFAVSPGFTTTLLESAEGWDLPYLPAASTPAEVMTLVEAGYSTIKFFPAASLGGIEGLRAISAPLHDVRFCPSGGIDESNFRDYCALDCVIAVSGSWLTPSDAIEARDFDRITQLALNAVNPVAN